MDAKGLGAPQIQEELLMFFNRSQWAQHLHYMGCSLVVSGTWSALLYLMTLDVAVSLRLLSHNDHDHPLPAQRRCGRWRVSR